MFPTLRRGLAALLLALAAPGLLVAEASDPEVPTEALEAAPAPEVEPSQEPRDEASPAEASPAAEVPQASPDTPTKVNLGTDPEPADPIHGPVASPNPSSWEPTAIAPSRPSEDLPVAIANDVSDFVFGASPRSLTRLQELRSRTDLTPDEQEELSRLRFDTGLAVAALGVGPAARVGAAATRSARAVLPELRSTGLFGLAADASQATIGRDQTTRVLAKGGPLGTGDGTPQGVFEGLYGVTDRSGRTTGLRNGLDGSGTVVATQRLTPEGIEVVRNQPGAYLSRDAAFHQARRVAGVPANSRPGVPPVKERNPLTDQFRGNELGRRPREYLFDRGDGTFALIQEHSYGHKQDMLGPHFNLHILDRNMQKVDSQYLPPGADTHIFFAR